VAGNPLVSAPGVDVNRVSDPAFHDGPSANAAFNGLAVEVTAASG
jgi:hypothetical protein